MRGRPESSAGTRGGAGARGAGDEPDERGGAVALVDQEPPDVRPQRLDGLGTSPTAQRHEVVVAAV